MRNMNEWNDKIYKYTKHISWVWMNSEVLIIDEKTEKVLILKNINKDFILNILLNKGIEL